MAVRAARKVGELSCSKCIPTVTNKPVLFGELLDDLLRRRDLKARDETERLIRRRKERARVAYLRARFGARPVVSIASKDVEALYADLKARKLGSREHARPLATSTVDHHMKLLRAVLRFGVKRGLLVSSPAGLSNWPERTMPGTAVSVMGKNNDCGKRCPRGLRRWPP
jgi:hypothetical protein